MISPRARTVVVTRHEFLIPSPASGSDIQDTLLQAARAYRRTHGLDNEVPLRDDALQIESHDDELCIYFTTKEEAS